MRFTFKLPKKFMAAKTGKKFHFTLTFKGHFSNLNILIKEKTRKSNVYIEYLNF